jgi:ATP-dependent Lon protease
MNSETFSLLPLRDFVAFPDWVGALAVGREKSLRAIDEAGGLGGELVLAAQRSNPNGELKQDDIFSVGTVSRIVQLNPGPDGGRGVLMAGLRRVRIDRYVETGSVFRVEVIPMAETVRTDQ